MKLIIFLITCVSLISCGTTTCGIGESPKKSWDVIQAQGKYGLSAINTVPTVETDTIVIMPVFDGKTVKQWAMITMDSAYLFTWIKESKENYGYLTISADDISVDLENLRERETYCYCNEQDFYNPNRYYWNITPEFLQKYPFE